MLVPFRHLRFRQWIIGATASNTSLWLQTTGMSWLVLTTGARGVAAVGVVLALQFLPAVVLVPFVGRVMSRYDARRILIVTQTTMMVGAVLLTVIAAFGTLTTPILMAASLVAGAVSALDKPNRIAVCPDLVPSSALSSALGLTSASFNVGQLVGPAMGGLLLATTAPSVLFACCAALWLLMVVMLVTMGPMTERSKPQSRRQSFRAAASIMARDASLRVVLVTALLTATGGGASGVYIAGFIETMASDSTEFGLLTTAVAVGALVGALFAASVNRGDLSTLQLAGITMTTALLIATIAPVALAFGATMSALGFGTVLAMNVNNARIYLLAPSSVRGSALAIYAACATGGAGIGAIVLGAVSAALGYRFGLIIGALACFTLWVIVRIVRKRS